MVEPTGKKCDCDERGEVPYRDYGTKICLGCGGILDFESGTLHKINEDGSLTEI